MNTLSFRPDDDFFQRKYQRPRKFTPPDSNCSPKFGPFRRTLVWYSEPSGNGTASDVSTISVTVTDDDGGVNATPFGQLGSESLVNTISADF